MKLNAKSPAQLRIITRFLNLLPLLSGLFWMTFPPHNNVFVSRSTPPRLIFSSRWSTVLLMFSQSNSFPLRPLNHAAGSELAVVSLCLWVGVPTFRLSVFSFNMPPVSPASPLPNNPLPVPHCLQNEIGILYLKSKSLQNLALLVFQLHLLPFFYHIIPST